MVVAAMQGANQFIRSSFFGVPFRAQGHLDKQTWGIEPATFQLKDAELLFFC